ncbi:MAG TPA: tetratricopeptide repeat protein [Blastocatellia bacterium]|nr:tetratricopeptide repeat protein [Blastocatellia bacterium]
MTSEPAAAVAHAAKQPSVQPDEAPEAAMPARWRGIYVLIPVALALVASINTLWNNFASDDTQQVLNNVFIKSFKNLSLAITSSVWSFVSFDINLTAQPYYRPLFSILFMINYALFGTSAWGWHLVNVLIHAAVTLMVFVVCKEITQRRWLSIIAASLFAVHPVHAESVAWISGVTDPLMALFLLPAFYFYLRYKKSGRRYQMALVLALYFLGLWSKETAVALPLVIAYCELFHFADSASLRRRIIRLAAMAGLFALPTAIYLFTRYNALGTLTAQDELRYPADAALLTIPIAIAKYLKLIVLPIGYSYQHYTPFVTSLVSLRFIAPLALVAALTIGVVMMRSRLARLAAVWFAAFLAPALLAIRNFDPEYVAQERYLYLPSMGFCLLVALAVEWIAARRFFNFSERAAAAALAALLVIVWGAAYVRLNRTWQDTITLFRNCVEVEPESAAAHSALGSTYYFAGKLLDGEAELRRALELDPAYPLAYLNMSYFSYQQGNADKAIDYLEQAVSTIPPDPFTRSRLANIYTQLGVLYAERKEPDRAIESARKSLELWSRNVGIYYAGLIHIRLGDYEEEQKRKEKAQALYEQARPFYEEVIRRAPTKYAPIHLSMGSLYERLKLTDQAMAEYQKYLELAMLDAPDRQQVEQRLRQLQNAQSRPQQNAK